MIWNCRNVFILQTTVFFFILQTHSGSVWRVTWAHPEFGQVLASCSFDRTAAVWEEIVGESNDKLRGQSHWVRLERLTLVLSRRVCFHVFCALSIVYL